MADEPPNAALIFARLMGDFQNSFGNFDRLHQMHRKNLEAMMELNQLSVEAMQSFARRQADIMQRTTTMFARASSEMMARATRRTSPAASSRSRVTPSSWRSRS